MNMSKKSLSVVITATAIVAFSFGLYFSGLAVNKSSGLQMGKYVWDHDKNIAGMYQELIVRPDSGYFLIPEPYQESTWFKIEGDQLLFNDSTVFDYYITEDGVGVIWTPTTHQMWKFIE